MKWLNFRRSKPSHRDEEGQEASLEIVMRDLVVGVVLFVGGILLASGATQWMELKPGNLLSRLILCYAMTPAMLFCNYVNDRRLNVWLVAWVWLFVVGDWVALQVVERFQLDQRWPMVPHGKHGWSLILVLGFFFAVSLTTTGVRKLVDRLREDIWKTSSPTS